MTAPETFASLRSTLDHGAPSRHEVDGALRRALAVMAGLVPAIHAVPLR